MSEQPSVIRVYVDMQNGICRAAPIVQAFDTGNLYQLPVHPQALTMPTKVAHKHGHPIISLSKFLQLMVPQPIALPSTTGVSQAVDQKGVPLLTRSETQGLPVAFDSRKVVLGLLNTSSSLTTKVPIGDALGMIADKYSISAVPGTITVSGTYGTSTLAYIKNFSASLPFRISNLRLEAGSTNASTFFSTGQLKAYKGSVDNSVVEVDLQINVLTKASDFNALIQNISIDFMFMPLSAMVVTIPPSTGVTFTFDVVSAAEVFNMQLQSQNRF